MKTGRLTLSEREQLIVSLLLSGLQVKAIAARLYLSKQAVSFSLRQVLKRHGIDNYAQLGMLAERDQVLPFDVRNRIEDRREVRMEALRGAP